MQFAIPVYDSLQLGCMVHGGGEGSNGEHFSAIEGPGPGSVCVCGWGGDVEIFHCHRGYVERFH